MKIAPLCESSPIGIELAVFKHRLNEAWARTNSWLVSIHNSIYSSIVTNKSKNRWLVKTIMNDTSTTGNIKLYFNYWQNWMIILQLLAILNNTSTSGNINPLTPIGSPVTHENWPMNWPDFATSPARLGWPATQQTHCGIGMHASIFSTYSDDHPSRQSGFMSEWRAIAIEHAGI